MKKIVSFFIDITFVVLGSAAVIYLCMTFLPQPSRSIILAFYFFYSLMSIVLVDVYHTSVKLWDMDKKVSIMEKACIFLKLFPRCFLISLRFIPLGYLGFIAAMYVHANSMQKIGLKDD